MHIHGSQALHLEPRSAIKALRDVTRECEELLVLETWLVHGQNVTRTGEAR